MVAATSLMTLTGRGSIRGFNGGGLGFRKPRPPPTSYEVGSWLTSCAIFVPHSLTRIGLTVES